jgi:hypothetical protein
MFQREAHILYSCSHRCDVAAISKRGFAAVREAGPSPCLARSSPGNMSSYHLHDADMSCYHSMKPAFRPRSFRITSVSHCVSPSWHAFWLFRRIVGFEALCRLTPDDVSQRGKWALVVELAKVCRH